MQIKKLPPIAIVLFVISCSTTRNNEGAKISAQRAPVKCMENSPERQGKEGCTILAIRLLSGPLPEEAYWHIDRFNSLEAATKAAGPNSVAAEAHGSFWLLTVTGRDENHHGGEHVAWIGPIAGPPAEKLTLRVQSSLLNPGATTPIHVHPGPEMFYIVDGEQCIETPENGQHLSAGQSYIVPAGKVHRGRVIGAKPRRAMALILYDAVYPASRDLEDSHQVVGCR